MKASTASLKDNRTLYETDWYIETGTTFLGHEDFYIETELPVNAHTNTNTSLEDSYN